MPEAKNDSSVYLLFSSSLADLSDRGLSGREAVVLPVNLGQNDALASGDWGKRDTKQSKSPAWGSEWPVYQGALK